ncbi:hypothetical protein EVAR_17442_1 [Eumeta japonica]|uniref:Uncharacterized protein n=1 Tax=Eumeta variegata TaxID=151549 RepID=A0A4C1VAL4_EUMVA|nr:hypothetical protein EVAR_17442_1 [Eumeta japonica]
MSPNTIPLLQIVREADICKFQAFGDTIPQTRHIDTHVKLITLLSPSRSSSFRITIGCGYRFKNERKSGIGTVTGIDSELWIRVERRIENRSKELNRGLNRMPGRAEAEWPRRVAVELKVFGIPILRTSESVNQFLTRIKSKRAAPTRTGGLKSKPFNRQTD